MFQNEVRKQASRSKNNKGIPFSLWILRLFSQSHQFFLAANGDNMEDVEQSEKEETLAFHILFGQILDVTLIALSVTDIH